MTQQFPLGKNYESQKGVKKGKGDVSLGKRNLAGIAENDACT